MFSFLTLLFFPNVDKNVIWLLSPDSSPRQFGVIKSAATLPMNIYAPKFYVISIITLSTLHMPRVH